MIATYVTMAICMFIVAVMVYQIAVILDNMSIELLTIRDRLSRLNQQYEHLNDNLLDRVPVADLTHTHMQGDFHLVEMPN